MIKLTSAMEQTRKKLDVEIEKIVQSVRSEYQAAQAQEKSLMAALNQQKGEALSMNRKAIDYGVLARDVESSKQLYNNLLQRAKETGVAGELKTSNVRVVDRAERPRRPVSPRKGTNILLSLFVGTLLACGLALSFEYLDNRISSPEEFRAHLGLVHLGLLPVLPGVDGSVSAAQRRRAGRLQRGVPGASHQRALLVGRRGRAHAGGDEHRPTRRQEPRVGQPRRRARTGRPARAPRRCRPAQASGARDLPRRPGTGPVERDGGKREGQ